MQITTTKETSLVFFCILNEEIVTLLLFDKAMKKDIMDLEKTA